MRPAHRSLLTAHCGSHRQPLPERELDGGPGGHHHVPVLGLHRALGPDRAAQHAADHRPLGAPADHPPHHRADRGAGAHLGDVAGVGGPPLKLGAHRVDGRVERVGPAVHRELRGRQRQRPGLVALVLGLVDRRDLERQHRAGRHHHAPAGVPDVPGDFRPDHVTHLVPPGADRVGEAGQDRGPRLEARPRRGLDRPRRRRPGPRPRRGRARGARRLGGPVAQRPPAVHRRELEIAAQAVGRHRLAPVALAAGHREREREDRHRRLGHRQPPARSHRRRAPPAQRAANSSWSRRVTAAPGATTTSRSLVSTARWAPTAPPSTPPITAPFPPPSTLPTTAPIPAPAPTLATSPALVPRPTSWLSTDSTVASSWYSLPSTVTAWPLSFRVPVLSLLFSDSWIAVIVNVMVEPAGITTRPSAARRSWV